MRARMSENRRSRTVGCPVCSIIPPFVLNYLSRHNDKHVADASDATLRATEDAVAIRQLLTSRNMQTAPDLVASGSGPSVLRRSGLRRQVFDCEGYEEPPGEPCRSEGDAPTADAAVNRAYDGAGVTWQFYNEIFGRDSIDGAGRRLVASVHYGRSISNAVWNGLQMLYGDGDGIIFNCFTSSVDVIAHEITHGVTQYTSKLAYHGESGALNESFSDVFGILVKQWVARQEGLAPNWLIGEELFRPDIRVRALRDMENPGTAFVGSALDAAADQQVGHYDQYRPSEDDGDGGGVHKYSGIPNRAFVIAAKAIGGDAWDIPGKIWYTVLTGGERDASGNLRHPEIGLSPTARFADCARATAAAARILYPDRPDIAAAVVDGWRQTGVLTSTSDAGLPRGMI